MHFFNLLLISDFISFEPRLNLLLAKALQAFTLIMSLVAF
jgi:hypothetical protein